MTISEECETLYNKLNTFVTSVINRDVTPKINNLESGKANTVHSHNSSQVIEINALPYIGTDARANQSGINVAIDEKVSSLNNSITNLVQIQNIAFDFGTLTVNSSSTKTKTVKAKPDGMDSTVILRIQNFCTVQGANLNGTSFSLTAQNQSNGTHTCNAHVLLVYFPSSWSI